MYDLKQFKPTLYCLILLAALVLFGAGSLAVAYAPSPAAFIAARVLLGVGAAAIIPLSLSALTVLFTPRERPRAASGFRRMSTIPWRTFNSPSAQSASCSPAEETTQ